MVSQPPALSARTLALPSRGVLQEASHLLLQDGLVGGSGPGSPQNSGALETVTGMDEAFWNIPHLTL